MVIDFKGRWFAKELILQCIRWYLAYKMSYRDLEEMMAERGVVADHSTIHRCVVRYSPALEAEFRRGKRLVGGSWRMDETYIEVKGTWKYLYRAVDKDGKTVDFLLAAKRDTTAADRFFLKALRSPGIPKKLTMDKSGRWRPRSNMAAADLFVKDLSADGKSIGIRQVKYLNNIVEQDHRGVKRRTGPMLGFKSFVSAQRTLTLHQIHRALWHVQGTPAQLAGLIALGRLLRSPALSRFALHHHVEVFGEFITRTASIRKLGGARYVRAIGGADLAFHLPVDGVFTVRRNEW